MNITHLVSSIIIIAILCNPGILNAQEIYQAPAATTKTKWISPENPTGAKAMGGLTNKGAKGNAFFTLKAGEQLVLMDVKGTGIINRMWLSGTIPRNAEQRRLIRIDMYWDGATKPAVSAPIGDFFGIALGLVVPFENALFSNPEGRSFNCNIPMPYRKSAKIVLTNQSPSHALVWYDINYTELEKLPADAMYFHAYWNRVPKTELTKDYALLPTVKGRGRFIGSNIGVIGDSAYRGTWFGEGEVKIYTDGDTNIPTLVGTGTEDYIGSGWGQGTYYNRFQGSLLSDDKNDLYAFYRYHIPDPVYFHTDCKVTIQQMGSAAPEKIKEIIAAGANLIPVWTMLAPEGGDIINMQGKPSEQIMMLDSTSFPRLTDKNFPSSAVSVNYYRSDDVSATAYFYLDKPSSNLPPLPSQELRMKDMKEKVWSKVKMD
ncbi:MAG: DUF2961 domain-containing protein [Agriterribacter sp.]